MSRNEHLATLLTGLDPVEVFDFYDGPRFYSCRDSVGQLYVVYWVDEDPEGASWLYLRVSPERYTSLKQGNVSIAYALSHPEEGTAFVVRTLGSETSPSVTEVQPKDIDSDWLPPEFERLNLSSGLLPEKTVSAVDAARRGNRQVFDLAFQKANNTYEMGCGKLGRILEAVQSMMFSLACPPDRDVRRIPEEVKADNEIFVTGLFASSFGIRLQTSGFDLFGNESSSNAIQQLTHLIEALPAPDRLSSDLHELNVLSRSRFKHLLRMMIEAEVSVTADWGSPLGQGTRSRATLSEISNALRRLELTDDATTQVVDRSGRLVGVDVQNSFFALVIEGGDVLKGTLATAVVQQRFEIPSQVNVKLQETCVVDPLTGREKWSYILLSVH